MVKRPPYSVGSNIAYALRVYWHERRSLVFFAALGIASRVALPLAGILMPKLLLDALAAQTAPGVFLRTAGGLAALLVALSFLKHYTDVKIDDNFGNVGSVAFGLAGLEKMMHMDYALLEDPQAKVLAEKADRATQSNHTMACNLLKTVSAWIASVLGIFVFGGLISRIHPLLLALLALCALINWRMLAAARAYELRTREARADTDGKLSYLYRALSDRAMAKDMRLYGIAGWLNRLFDTQLARKQAAETAVATRTLRAQCVDALLVLVREGAAYALLLSLLLRGDIALGDFALLLAAIGLFADWAASILLQSSDLLRASSEMSDLRAYLDLPDAPRAQPAASLPPLDRAPEIYLEDVTYAYPNAQAPALAHIQLRIRPGERIAIVGANGAGKTTLVKLVCGLYRPQGGTVSLAGHDLAAYDRDACFTLFSAVFQDIHLLTTSIAGNVSQQTLEATDRARVAHCLALAGLQAKVQALPHGMDTLLVQEVHKEATALSGGELQKLALARALYKDAPVIVLDEPTAALDPLAESEMYQRYAALTQGKTSLYISHRLASTRFCDRILFLDGQRIAEEGTHDELMRLGGQYAATFAIQASYYRTAKGGEAHA